MSTQLTITKRVPTLRHVRFRLRYRNGVGVSSILCFGQIHKCCPIYIIKYKTFADLFIKGCLLNKYNFDMCV